jgi:peptidoglycan/xylan/chitin deacetylase (PgdA/CDA1 family)
MRLFIFLLILTFQTCIAQPKQVSITIDDVPNTSLYKEDGFKSKLLDRLDAMNIPVAIFINEKNIYKTEFQDKNLEGLTRWLKNKNVIAGNHSYSHVNYADTTLKGFQQDILKGEQLTTKITHQRPGYFRFPYNSLGGDSIAHASIRQFLKDQGYTLTPFTVESEDWAYNTLYENALKNHDNDKARQIGEQYVTHTLKMFQYFETLTQQLYGSAIRHIYLCHDNRLNTDFMEKLLNELRSNGYSFITLKEALEDNVYQSNEYYFGRYGFSWIYRWQQNGEKRRQMMRGEPVDEDFRKAYDQLANKK